MTIILLIIIILSIIFTFTYLTKDQVESFYSLYGFINDDISKSNPISVSGKINPYKDINQKIQRDPIVYQSHGIPLIHEDHPTIPTEKSMFYFANHKCHPNCCQYSSFSCSNGCVCWNEPTPEHVDQNFNITPRS